MLTQVIFLLNVFCQTEEGQKLDIEPDIYLPFLEVFPEDIKKLEAARQKRLSS